MKRIWRAGKGRKEKGHINVAKLTSLLSGMMITNARLSYIQTLGEQKSFIVFKKILRTGGDVCHYWIVLPLITPSWAHRRFALRKP
ncbi:hypothetical protein F3I52_20885 [Pantoea sp. M_8]|uniref:Uncharacterized protein n=1 Tax=Pantoea anthophila TaxID=470931 RepID=A0ABY2Z3S5_9GAMM|nr:hypothetical protein F3I51_18815 [Pantoea sp. M_6]KAA5971272.1 hypothetical protein F3I52_20885 [Pantoea sp. M_8]KAA5988987.1 hypothetical protein F3I47_14900 [Pantoea sp. M_10]TPV22697.1 hypothetical protein FJW00_17230 [Pantoea anthophila]